MTTTPVFDAPILTPGAIISAQRSARVGNRGDVLVIVADDAAYAWTHYRDGVSQDSGTSPLLPLARMTSRRWDRIDLHQRGQVASGAHGWQVVSLNLSE